MKCPIYAHLAAQLDSRLALLLQAPQHILLHGDDGGHSRTLLAARYPQARRSEMNVRAGGLSAGKSGWFGKMFGKKNPMIQHDWRMPLPEAQYDMLWSNLSLLQSNDVLGSLKNWAGALKTDGVLFFTHLGRDSLPEIRTLLAQQNIACAAPSLLDMHDLADMMHDNGFYDPVADTANVVLDYHNPAALWHDLDDLNAWVLLQTDDETAAREAVRQAAYSGSLKQLTLQTVFGHGVKKHIQPENERVVRFYRK